MKGTFPFSILVEDYKNSKGYHDTMNCPAAMAFKRQFPDVSFGGIGTLTIDSTDGEEIATIEPQFLYGGYRELAHEDKEFHCKITFE